MKALLLEGFSEVHFTGTNVGANNDEVIIHYDDNFDPIRAAVYKDSPLLKLNPWDWEVADIDELARYRWKWKPSGSMLVLDTNLPTFVWWIKQLGYVENRLNEATNPPKKIKV